MDITDPADPVGDGSISLTELGDADDQPTSVAVRGGYLFVVVDTTGGELTAPSGRVDVVDLATRAVVRSIDLGGQPDSIDVAPDGSVAAIALENQRDEELTPPGSDVEGDLPQLPAGGLVLLDLPGDDPDAWTLRTVPLVNPDGSALPALAGLYQPTDPEPEYVDVNAAGQVVLTLQENNGVALIDTVTGTVTRAFDAGTVTVDGIDTEDDGVVDQTGSITDVPREPDAVAWISDTLVATANEGDLLGGTRGWTVFDTATGAVVFDAGASFEELSIRVGLHDESRSDNKGAEPEGIAFAEIDGTPLLFVGSERANFVAVYDVSDPTAPQFRQVLATTNGPEGIKPVPARDLLLVSSETDDAGAGVRATVAAFGYGDTWAADAGTPQFPSIVSDDLPVRPELRAAPDGGGAAIGWGALSGLTADPADPQRAFTVNDDAYSPTQIFGVDLTGERAVIDSALPLTRDGEPLAGDAEGVFARPGGGFWVVLEGATGAGNELLRVDAAGVVTGTVALPAEVAAGLTTRGFEGVTATTVDGAEAVFVAFQSPLADEGDVTRIGRYDVTAGTWSFAGYPLGTMSVEGDRIGLSEVVAIDEDSLAVVERDSLNGPDAAVKRVYALDLPTFVPAGQPLPVVEKTLVVDVLPALRATNGWTQEKLEGLTVTGDGRLRAVTDNDGLDDATGETVLLDLGAAEEVFAAFLDQPPVTTSPAPTTAAPVPTTASPTTTAPPSTTTSTTSAVAGSGTGRLPNTGADVLALAAWGAGVLAVGAGLVLVARRRGAHG